MKSVDKNINPLKNIISKELRDKANDFLNNRAKANNLLEIIEYLEKASKVNQCITPSLLTLEVVFVELLRRRDLLRDNAETNPSEAERKYCNWLNERYEETWSLMLNLIDYEKPQESSQALVSCMNLLAEEGKNPIDTVDAFKFPRYRLRRVLEKLISAQRVQSAAIISFKKYAVYCDVVQNCWHLLSNMIKKLASKNEIVALNCLQLLQNLPATADLEEQNLLCPLAEKAPGCELFNYVSIRKCINKVWSCLMLWLDTDTPESVHKQMLIVLLECILPHLEKPVLLTDFLMDSLDCADIFLSSTHLPENLVAAFVKRLARLSLIAPPQDAIIVLYFIGNLLLRHSGLKSLICAQQPEQVAVDPFMMDEREPTKSNAIKSSLWEIVALQKHAIPSVATAARFISQPLPNREWDLSSVLELKENDIFDQEISKKSKMYALAFERPQSMFSPKNDKFQNHWCLF